MQDTKVAEMLKKSVTYQAMFIKIVYDIICKKCWSFDNIAYCTLHKTGARYQ